MSTESKVLLSVLCTSSWRDPELNTIVPTTRRDTQLREDSYLRQTEKLFECRDTQTLDVLGDLDFAPCSVPEESETRMDSQDDEPCSHHFLMKSQI